MRSSRLRGGRIYVGGCDGETAKRESAIVPRGTGPIVQNTESTPYRHRIGGESPPVPVYGGRAIPGCARRFESAPPAIGFGTCFGPPPLGFAPSRPLSSGPFLSAVILTLVFSWRIGLELRSGSRSLGGPRKILYLDNTTTFGGAINSLAELVAGLDPSRFTPIVATPQPEATLRERLPGIETRRVRPVPHRSAPRTGRPGLESSGPRSRSSTFGQDRAKTALRLLGETSPEALQIARLARREGAELIHLNNNLESQEAGVLAARLIGLPCVAHARSFQVGTRFLRWIARRVDRHVAISNAIAQNLRDLGIPESRIVLIHDGIRCDRFADVPSRHECRVALGIPSGSFAFGIFGRLVPWKGIAEFVEVAAEIVRSDPDATAFVVGSVSDGDDDYYDTLRERVNSLGLADRIVFTGFRPDVRQAMAAMDLVVHASTEPEPFGMVLIEAMSLGRPIVATRGGGPEDIVLHGETGLLVERGAIREMRNAIVELRENPERARAMGEKGRDRVRTNFSAEIHTSRVSRMYDELLKE
ncbi:MAG: glycosyltransferase family 4 protein [Gemmatimonadota bacterium]